MAMKNKHHIVIMFHIMTDVGSLPRQARNCFQERFCFFLTRFDFPQTWVQYIPNPGRSENRFQFKNYDFEKMGPLFLNSHLHPSPPATIHHIPHLTRWYKILELFLEVCTGRKALFNKFLDIDYRQNQNTGKKDNQTNSEEKRIETQDESREKKKNDQRAYH